MTRVVEAIATSPRVWFQYWIRSMRVTMSTTLPVAASPARRCCRPAAGGTPRRGACRRRAAGSGRAMTSPTVTLRRVAVVVQDAGERHLLDAADRLAVVAAPAAARCRSPAAGRSPAAAVASGAIGDQLPRAALLRAGRRPSAAGGSAQLQLVRGQPGVVEELAQVVAAGVGAEGDDQVAPAPAGGRSAGRRRRSCRCEPPSEHALAAGQLAGDVERLGVADAHPVVDELAVERLGHEVLADALDLPRLAASRRTGPSLPGRRR